MENTKTLYKFCFSLGAVILLVGLVTPARAGSGANFLVKWKSQTKVNPPLIEGVMIGTRSGQGISFVSRGQVINE